MVMSVGRKDRHLTRVMSYDGIWSTGTVIDPAIQKFVDEIVVLPLAEKKTILNVADKIKILELGRKNITLKLR